MCFTYKSFAVGKLRKCDLAFLVLKRVRIFFSLYFCFIYFWARSSTFRMNIIGQSRNISGILQPLTTNPIQPGGKGGTMCLRWLWTKQKPPHIVTFSKLIREQFGKTCHCSFLFVCLFICLLVCLLVCLFVCLIDLFSLCFLFQDKRTACFTLAGSLKDSRG